MRRLIRGLRKQLTDYRTLHICLASSSAADTALVCLHFSCQFHAKHLYTGQSLGWSSCMILKIKLAADQMVAEIDRLGSSTTLGENKTTGRTWD